MTSHNDEREEQPAEQPIELWATAKGFLPQFSRTGIAGGEVLNPEWWKYSSAKAFKRWEDGARVSEADFDAAIADVQKHAAR